MDTKEILDILIKMQQKENPKMEKLLNESPDANQACNIGQWWDPEKVRNDKVLQETRMPESLEDVRTGLE